LCAPAGSALIGPRVVTSDYLFPNTQLSVYGNGGAIIARALLPLDEEHTAVTLDYWFDPEITAASEAAFVDWFEELVGEDTPLCESVQRGVRSGTLERGLLRRDHNDGAETLEFLYGFDVGELADVDYVWHE
jgi:choline monooxygenase